MERVFEVGEVTKEKGEQGAEEWLGFPTSRDLVGGGNEGCVVFGELKEESTHRKRRGISYGQGC